MNHEISASAVDPSSMADDAHREADLFEEVTIEKLVYGGEGLGRLPAGEVVFVPWSVPGDRLRVSRVPGKTRPVRMRIEQLVTPAAERVEPRCSVFGTCGGCQWQQVDGAAQRLWKRRIVEESLQRIGQFRDVSVLEPLTGADNLEPDWHYRQRVQWDLEWTVSAAGEALLNLGYHQAQSSSVVAFQTCHIIPEPLNALAAALTQILRGNPPLTQGLVRIEAMMNAERQCLLLLEGQSDVASLKALAERCMEAVPNLAGVSWRSLERRGEAVLPRLLAGVSTIEEQVGEQAFQVSAGSFFQTNRQALQALLAVLAQWLPTQGSSLLDVYAGVGLFGLHFASRFQRVTLVEGAPSAVEDLHVNVGRTQEASQQQERSVAITVQAGDARRVLPRLQDMFEVAIVDPPRTGCVPEVLDWLSEHVQRQLVYVSCNPTTLARDLKHLVAQGWRLEAVQPIDMFPQTYHVECVVNLKRA